MIDFIRLVTKTISKMDLAKPFRIERKKKKKNEKKKKKKKRKKIKNK